MEYNVGIGFGEEMTRTQVDSLGYEWPAYGFKNDENFQLTQPKDVPQILWGIKANGPLKAKIQSNTYSRLTNGKVRFLIKEQEAKNILLSTKKGQQMTTEQRIKRLLPHEMTTKLFDEMSNLRLKRSGSSTDIVLEPINTRFHDDKYYSFAYGLWRIKELEEENAQRNRRRSGSIRRLVFFTGGE